MLNSIAVMAARRALTTLLFAAMLLLTACAGASDAKKVSENAAELEVHFFDAGKADAILLTTQSGTVLIDAGEKGFGKTILSYLEEKGVERIDYFIITHFDQDHVGGAAKVINNITVGTVLQSNRPKDSEEYEKYVKALANAGVEPVTVREVLTFALDGAGIEPVTVRETYAFALDGVSYTVDPPRQSEYSADSSNNSSLIVTVRNGENRFLFMGDAQTERLAEFLDGNPAACDVLKIPHHGKDEPLLGELLEATQPSFAVITSSDEEPESTETVGTLERMGVRVLLTREGAVTLRSDGANIAVSK